MDVPHSSADFTMTPPQVLWLWRTDPLQGGNPHQFQDESSEAKTLFLFSLHCKEVYFSSEVGHFKTRVYWNWLFFFLELASSGSSWNCNTASYLFVIPENITFWARHPALSPFCRIVSCFSAGGQKSLEHSSIVCKPNKTPCIHRSCICLQYQYFCVHFLL